MPASLVMLAETLFREEVMRARSMSPEDRLLEGPRLFDRACRVMADGIRHRQPELDEQAVLARLEEYLNRLHALSTP